MRFNDLVAQVDELRKQASGIRLAAVTEVALTISGASSQLTDFQKKELAKRLSGALVGKLVSWELHVSDVTENPVWLFQPLRTGCGLWIEHVEYYFTGMLVVLCNAQDQRVKYLPKGQAVVASGPITSVEVGSGPAVLALQDAVLSGVDFDALTRKTNSSSQESSFVEGASQPASPTVLPRHKSSYQGIRIPALLFLAVSFGVAVSQYIKLSQPESIPLSVVSPPQKLTPRIEAQETGPQAPEDRALEGNKQPSPEARGRLDFAKLMQGVFDNEGRIISVKAIGKDCEVLELSSPLMAKGSYTLRAAERETVDCPDCMRLIRKLKFKRIEIKGGYYHAAWQLE